MEKVSPATTAAVADEIDETQPIVRKPFRRRARLLGEASSLLVTWGIRAAQNHAVYCLDEWIAPSPVLGTKNRGLVMLDGGPGDDRSSS